VLVAFDDHDLLAGGHGPRLGLPDRPAAARVCARFPLWATTVVVHRDTDVPDLDRDR
jgi:hypothetical protein